MMNLRFSFFAAGLLMAVPAFSQGTLEDYDRAYTVKKDFSSLRVYHWAHEVQWKDSSDIFSYQMTTRDGKGQYVVYDAANGTERTFDVKDELEKALGIVKEPEKRPWPGRVQQRHWMEVDEETELRPVTSPDGKMEAYVEGQNIVVHRIGTPFSTKRVLSQDGTTGCYYSNRILWSPDGRYLFDCKRIPVQKRYVYYVESSPADQLQPILHKQEYAKPGDALPQKIPVIFDLKTGKQLTADGSAISNQYELSGFQWNADGQEVMMEYNQRGHHLYQVLSMNANTGKIRVVVQESSPKYINYQRMFRYYTKDGKRLIWMSERDNWNHLYLYDVPTGKVIRQITKGPWCVRQVLNVDEPNRVIYFSASGVNKDEDPYLIHYYRIGLDGNNMICLTPEPAQHQAAFSSDYHYLVDTYSLVDQAPVTVLRDACSGKLIKVLEKADISDLLVKGWKAPVVFKAKGRDGKTDMWGIIQRPVHFDPSKKYPVIEYIYAGPGDAYTPKSFISYNWNTTSLAELGFVVVQLDAMGTSWRGKKFEEVCYKNLKDAGFPDRELWIKAAAKKYPYMDADNVGIFGASAGGQESCTAVLLHGDFYKAAYSSCGCHDNRMDKIWWNEQWMSYPVDSSYVRCSNIYNAPKLQRPLMLVVGELDDNVDPSSTYQVVNALEKANKDFELVVLPGVHHTMGERFGEHKRFDFFVKNLMHVNPPKWCDVKSEY
ncbi:MAG: S9 family peptidase [Prevotella sp.]|jgi:dipeptidyl aminopeptidase/acylaminoacyl peptidase|nr:S9 family peptidase [Prevotella sp.]MCH4212143.1 S9 family peptidase [Prevotella sp.]MCH4241141.1 S9 family peptidase [Prevotella sp.]